MPRSYILRCKRGSGKRWHKKSGQCRTPCKKAKGPGYRRSPKGPHYACIKQKPSKKSSKKSSPTPNLASLVKLQALVRGKLSRKKASGSGKGKLVSKISAGLKLKNGSIFTTEKGITYKKVPKDVASEGYIKLSK